MAIIHHAPSAESLMQRIRGIGFKSHAGDYGCRVHIENGPTVEIDYTGGQYGAKRKYRITATFTDARYHKQRRWIEFALQNATEGKKGAFSRDIVEYDIPMPDELWAKFEPKLKQVISEYQQADIARQRMTEIRDKSNAKYHADCAWLAEHAPQFSIGESRIRFICSDIELMKEKLKAAHAILFP